MWTLLFSFGFTSLFLSSTFAQSPLQIDIEKKFPGEDESAKGNILQTSTNLLSTTVYRLPRTVIPSRYILTILPIIETDDIATQWTAHGDVKIFAKCDQNTKSLTLHANGLNITEDFVYVMDLETRDTVTISSHEYDAEKHFYIIQFADELISGKEYEIFIRYIAPIADIDAMDGLYRSFYEDPATNTTRYLVATQMETIHARQMFPCMDEPEFKAVFEISIGRNNGKGYKAWANTELLRTAPMSGGLVDWVVDTFAPTTIMSTYLVAILVANDYDCTKADEALYNKPVQICAPNYIIEKGGGVYGAEVAAKHMQFLEDYFNVTYKFSKIDSASVPHFGSGAMENWGLNLYRESYLLFFEGETTEAERFLVSEVLGHELTHQWFGNLVTNKWWSEIWLNEGFATYYSYLASQTTDPEFEPTVIGQLNDCLQYSMAFASRWDYAHPVFQPVDSPTEVDLMFDRMAYEKAGSLIRMMQGFLTESTLKTGLTAYLNKMEYKGAEQDDLFSSLTAQAHSDGTLDRSLTVKGIMDTWTKRKGFPLVRVTRADATKLLISQEAFRNNDDMGIKGHRYPVQQDLESLWYVPVALITEDAPAVSLAPKFWISGDVAMTSFNHDTNKWILINPDAFGYYRVLYDGHLAGLLQNQLNRNHTVISKMSRSQLLDDYITFVFQKYVPIDKALEMTRYLHGETEFVVWKSVITNLRKTYNMLSSTSAINGFRNYFLPRLMFGALASIGIEQKETDKGAVVIFRSQVLDWACSMEDETCVQYAVRLFDEWVANPTNNTIPVDLQPIVYCTGVATKGESAFTFAFEQYKIATASRQQTLLLNSLACSKEVSLLQTVLEYAQDPTSGLRRPHAVSAIQRVAMNPLGRNIVLRFLNSNLNGIIGEFGSATPIATVVSTLSTYLNTNADRDTLNLFISSHETELSAVKASLDTSVINIATNIKWMEDFYDGMNTWFNAQQV